MLIRRTFTNNTGQPVTRLRFRVVDITTRGTCPGTCADLRALTSPGTLVVEIPATVQGVRLEDNPPLTPEGGGNNSSLSADFITLQNPLAPGATIAIQFKVGVVTGGNFRFFMNIEAQNGSPVIID
jgi:hypothetical protein